MTPNFGIDFEAHEAATIDITEEMRKAILDRRRECHVQRWYSK
jgi:hypothetical protein